MKSYRDASRVQSHGKLKSMVGTHAAGAIKGPVAPVDPAYEKAQAIPSSGPMDKVKAGKPTAPGFADGGAVLPGDEPATPRLDRPGRGGKPGATVNVIVAPGPKDAPPPPAPSGPMPTPPPMPMPPAGGPGGPAPMPPPGGGGPPPAMMANRGGRIGLKTGGGLSYSAKDAAAGKDIGKPGKNFAKIASKSGGGEKGKKIAGSILKNLRGG